MNTDNLEVSRENVRHLYKLCHVFNVEWMLTKCTEFYQQQFETSESAQNVTFLFEESIYLCGAGRSSKLLKIWISNITGKDAKGCHEYIWNYLDSTAHISKHTLEQLLELTRDHSVFLLYVNEAIINTGAEIEKRSRFLLQNMDIVGCSVWTNIWILLQHCLIFYSITNLHLSSVYTNNFTAN